MVLLIIVNLTEGRVSRENRPPDMPGRHSLDYLD